MNLTVAITGTLGAILARELFRASQPTLCKSPAATWWPAP
jgi:hypothetical protein